VDIGIALRDNRNATVHQILGTPIDRGPGIPDADLARVFDRFYKGATSTGSGLGLTIARNLVMAHGGTITAATGPHGGTVITVSLPERFGLR
jgi:signal transduction histidine kinase